MVQSWLSWQSSCHLMILLGMYNWLWLDSFLEPCGSWIDYMAWFYWSFGWYFVADFFWWFDIRVCVFPRLRLVNGVKVIVPDMYRGDFIVVHRVDGLLDKAQLWWEQMYMVRDCILLFSWITVSSICNWICILYSMKVFEFLN